MCQIIGQEGGGLKTKTLLIKRESNILRRILFSQNTRGLKYNKIMNIVQGINGVQIIMVRGKKTKKLTLCTSPSGRRGRDQMTFLINDLLYYYKGGAGASRSLPPSP